MVVKQFALLIGLSVGSSAVVACSPTSISADPPTSITPTPASQSPIAIPPLTKPETAFSQTRSNSSTSSAPPLVLPDLKKTVLSTQLNPDTLPPLPPLETVKIPVVTRANQGVTSATIEFKEPQSSFTQTANTVDISGMMQLGNSWSALVRLPNQSDYRYVVEGEFLAGGQVMVKQIGLDQNRQPLVILEENGIEVTKIINLEGKPETPN